MIGGGEGSGWNGDRGALVGKRAGRSKEGRVKPLAPKPRFAFGGGTPSMMPPVDCAALLTAKVCWVSLAL